MATRKAKVIPVVELPVGHTCRECRHVLVKRGDGLYCRRYPPEFVYEPSTGLTDTRNPEVQPDWTCGEFAAHLAS